MPKVNIGKYTKPGIYTEEFNDSQIETQNVAGLQTLIIGSSKNGPVNTPIELKSQSDLNKIFGDLDRPLEAKGSYFHRTVSKVLESMPVVAFNLLNPDDELDTLEYKSLSTSSGYVNDVKRNESYRRFFDTSSFWKKDRDSFLSFANENPNAAQRVFNLTNFSDKEITVFVVKSSVTGFNISLTDWYGSIDKVPLFVDGKDYASDYLVDVVVLRGNWTNYAELAIDPRWSKYFNTSGLIKSEIFNLANNGAVNNLATWLGLSLIPYFRDLTGQNIFIENKINQKTDDTGLYCAFDVDAVETDYRNGLIDLLGNSLIANNTADSINFLSYNEDINEVNNYSAKSLDRAGNVYQLTFDNYYQAATERTAFFAEGYVNDLLGDDASTADGSYPSTVGYATYSLSYTTGADPYAIIGGTKVVLADTTFDFTPDDFTTSSTNPGTTQSFREVFFIDSDGGIKRSPSNSQLVSGIVLGYADVIIGLDADRVKYFNLIDYTPVSVDDSGFVYFDDSNDITATVNTNQNAITYEFLDTTGTADITDYVTYRRWKVYNQLVSVFNSANSGRATILVDEDVVNNGNPWKMSVGNLTITISDDTNANRTIQIGGFDTGYLSSSILETNGLVLHIVDDELTIGANGMVTTNDWESATEGVVAVNSDLYQDYIDGIINTGDFFYENLIDGADNTSENTNFTYLRFMDVSGDDYIVVDKEINFNTNDVVMIPESTLNTGLFTIVSPSPVNIALPLGGTGIGYLVAEDTVTETIDNPTKVWDTGQAHYLKMYKVGDVLNIQFTDSTLSSISTTYNSVLDIISQNSNFRQTVEIEEPTGYVSPANVILVNGDRYTEIKIGDFLEADYDSGDLELGEIPRSMTRVLSKKKYVGDSSLVEITCDSAIKVYSFGGDKQTYRFSSIDDYASSYKGISLFGFRVRKDSMPNGTEERIKEILDIVGKGTPLYNAITDRNIIEYRYLVDSYGLGLTENSKQHLADICGKRLDCFGFINMPSMKSFRKSSSPSFVDSKGRLSTEFIKLGGDSESSPAFNYSLALGDGESCVGYFCPYVVVSDNGRPRDIPPAAYVATTYFRKHNPAISTTTPWTIAAGITDGQVTGIANLEYAFTGEDITNLNQMSVNPIISKKNRGRVIETENTAETLVNSALSYIHVREVLIELERDLYDMLLRYQWKFNTPEIRAEIKLRADAICGDYVTRFGLYNFFNKIDRENNTQEIIDNQMGVLDTYVEPIKGMSVIVNNVTIVKTGQINSGGFLSAS